MNWLLRQQSDWTLPTLQFQQRKFCGLLYRVG